MAVDGAEKTVDDCVQYDGLGRRGRCGSSAAYAREEAMPETGKFKWACHTYVYLFPDVFF